MTDPGLHSSKHPTNGSSPAISPASSVKRSHSRLHQRLGDLKEDLREKRKRHRQQRMQKKKQSVVPDDAGIPMFQAETRQSFDSEFSFADTDSISDYASSTNGEGEGGASIDQQLRSSNNTQTDLASAVSLPAMPAEAAIHTPITPLTPVLPSSDFSSSQTTPTATSFMQNPITTSGSRSVSSPTSPISANSSTTTKGIFSSVLSAAQNAANSLTNFTSNLSPVSVESPSSETAASSIIPDLGKSFTAPNGQSGDLSSIHHFRPRAETAPVPRHSGEFVDGIWSAKPPSPAPLGKGELSLSSILEDNAVATPPVATEDEEDKPTTPQNNEPVVDVTTAGNQQLQPSVVVADAPGRPNQSLGSGGSIRRRSQSVQRRRPSTSSMKQPTLVPASSPPPTQASTSQRVTGWAFANPKRNLEFHQLFRSVPKDDYLIEDYGCALSREILLQGRMYISAQHVCFNSNIFGWVTNLVISFDEIIAIEKKTTVGLFPNAIVVKTLHARNVFASFISRDTTFDLMYSIWRSDGIVGAGSDSLSSDDESEDESGSEEDEEEQELDEDGKLVAGGAQMPDLPPEVLGPITHEPTTCGCGPGDHYDKIICDEKFNVPLGRICNLLFGDDTKWIQNLLTNAFKNFDLSPITPFAPDAYGHKARTYNYIKPLNASIGPKQTKCLTTETILDWDLNSHVTVIVGTETPDVPNGNMFVTKTKYCFTWAENNMTRMLIMCTIEWSGKSWIKGAIEKGANDGQVQTSKDLVVALNAEFQSQALKAGGGRKKKRRHRGKQKQKLDNIPLRSANDEPEVNSILGFFRFDGTYVTYIFIFLLVLTLFVSLYTIFGRHPSQSDQWQVLWDLEEQKLWEWMAGQAPSRFEVLDQERSRTFLGDPMEEAGWLSKYEVERAIEITQLRLNLLREQLEAK
ncbi:uncharacterized protein V1516DRAFT_281644 [Lipomyces oligophaga]|uniref:uncharacterized protein n=1 Tax=Lipomyces oligophaga TaxID=45792 RepID=UPI0034CD40A8